jgi:hypothetical protein
MDDVGLKNCILGTSSSMITLTYFFPWCQTEVVPERVHTTNHKVYKALGRLHGPWCKHLVIV